MQQNISDSILYIGTDDKDLDLFEGQYLIPEGISYNSYVIVDEKIAVMDSVDDRKIDVWFEQLQAALNGRTPDYLVVTHMEPDHSSGIEMVMSKYPQTKIVGNAKTFAIMKQLFDVDNIDEVAYVVKEGDELSLGAHTLKFIMAPMVHWPEVMVAYESTSKTLFSADGFGKFGASDAKGGWACEARRYYYNIVGKYGANVQSLLKKLDGVPVDFIAPLHGPILREDIGYYVKMYDLWSRYQAEEDSILIAYASIHGNTAKVAHELKVVLKAKGKENVELCDLTRDDMAQAVEDAFYSETLVLAAASYDAGVFPPMEHYLHHLKSKNFQNRRVGIIENGSWAPTAAKTMKGMLESMKGITILDPVVTIRSSYKSTDVAALEALADELINKQ
ncbi:MAG: FprA family A-type flavoprotein [Rikenellaceae bacterium]